MLKLIAFLLLLCFGCQTGRIPCPKVKGPKLIKSGKRYRTYANDFPAPIESKEIVASREKPTSKPSDKYIKNVSVEEWDCPQPGHKKYLPKHVKQNIRKNARKINDDPGSYAADSTFRDP